MNKSVSLSVVIPNYNNEKFLRNCVESILAQTYKPAEIIIVDDCSTDNSRKIIEELSVENDLIRPCFLEKNGGVSNARNTGISLAKSEYITCIDGDDLYVNRDKLKNEMNLVQKWKNEQNRDVVGYSKVAFVEVDEDTSEWTINYPDYRENAYLQGNVFLRFLAGYQFKTSPRDYVLKKSLVISCGGYRTDMNLYEDTDLLMRLAQKAEFYCTGAYGTGYRLKDNGLSRRPKKDHDLVWKQMYQRYYTGLNDRDKRCAAVLKLYVDFGNFLYEIRKVLYKYKMMLRRWMRTRKPKADQ